MRIFVFICVFIFVPLKAIEAQIENKIGISAALTQIRFQTNIHPEFFKNKSGFSAAIKIQVLSGNFFALVPHLEYTQKRFIEIIHGSSREELRANTNFDYMSMPIFIRLHYTKYNIIPYFKVGPRLDILVNKDLGEFKIGQRILPAFFGKEFTHFVLGASLATGIEISGYLPLDLFIEFRYNKDLTDSLPDKESMDAKFSSYDIWLGILFSY